MFLNQQFTDMNKLLFASPSSLIFLGFGKCKFLMLEYYIRGARTMSRDLPSPIVGISIEKGKSQTNRVTFSANPQSFYDPHSKEYLALSSL